VGSVACPFLGERCGHGTATALCLVPGDL
jgi:hypothetical protein